MVDLKCIPKKYRDSIADFYKDDDGWWIELKSEGKYILDGYYSPYTIHEDTKAEALREFKFYITKK